MPLAAWQSQVQGGGTMGALATIVASIITSAMTVLAALAAVLIFGGRRAAALAGDMLSRAATAPVRDAKPAEAPRSPPLAAMPGLPANPSTHFSVHRARLEFLDSPAKVGRPCRVRFEWILFNGARSYITYRSRIRAQGPDGAQLGEITDPPETSPRAHSYQQRIVGEVDTAFTWGQPGVYLVRARVKAAIEGTPFTYQFEVERRVRVVVPKLSPATSDSADDGPVV
jgi:hypothetical protein